MEGTIVRRVIPSDNSCLFNAVGYVMDHDKLKAPKLRQIIAAAVSSDPVKYSEAFLGKPNNEYCSWILDSEKWGELMLRASSFPELHSKPVSDHHKDLKINPESIRDVYAILQWFPGVFALLILVTRLWIVNRGAIELSILADHYGREIAAYDIQTTRCDLYGQDRMFSERVMLIYDGLHYDALAISPFEGAPEEFDQTIFGVLGDRTIGPTERLALNFAKEQQRKRKFTDTANFTLRCGVCQIGVIGQKEAVEHAKATGHANFQEYN